VNVWTQIQYLLYLTPFPEEPPPANIRKYYGYIYIEIFLVCSVKLFYFCKSDVSAVHGHPRSLMLVPIESAYATSY